MEAFKKSDPALVKKDHGGVHIFSGIPNRAFVICALAFDGFAWEKAGKIWWATAMSKKIPQECSFIQFADVTVEFAKQMYGVQDAETVRAAWTKVGVVRHV